MIGDGQVLVAPLGGASHDVFQRALAVSRQLGVHVQIAANVLQANGRRKLTLLGLLDLPSVLPHGGRDQGQAQCPVDRLLRLPGDHLARLRVAQSVFVQQPSPREGPLPQLDVVRLGAGEVLARRPELRRLDDPQVHLEARGGQHRALRVAAAHDLPHRGQLHEGLHRSHSTRSSAPISPSGPSLIRS